MPLPYDPQLGSSPARNTEFEKTHTRGRIISDRIGRERASTIIDVGAYKGETAEWFSVLFPNATIWAVEPFPESFAELAIKSNPRIKPFNFAAANFDGQVQFHYNSIAPTSGIYPINSQSVDSLAIGLTGLGTDASKNSSAGNLVVVARTLNSFVVEQDIQEIDLLKIDVQAAEVDVLKGSGQILDRVGAVLIEISLYDYYENSSSIGDVELCLSPHGFTLWSVTDISNNPMNGRTDWVELLYVNSRRGATGK
jgi:FkbM family methyltransferase